MTFSYQVGFPSYDERRTPEPTHRNKTFRVPLDSAADRGDISIVI